MGGGREGGDGSARPPTQTQAEAAASDSKALPLLFSPPSIPLPEADVSNSNLLDTIRAKNRLGWMRRRREGGLSLPGTLLLLRLHYSTFVKQAWTRDIVQGAEMCLPCTLGKKYEGSKYLVPPTKKLF